MSPKAARKSATTATEKESAMPATTTRKKSDPTTAVKDVAVSAAKRAAQAVTTDQKKRMAEQAMRAAEKALVEAINETMAANKSDADEKMEARARRAMDKAKAARATARERAKDAGLPAPKFANLPRIRRSRAASAPAPAAPAAPAPTQEKPKKGAEKPARRKAVRKSAAAAPKAPAAAPVGDGSLAKAMALVEFASGAGWEVEHTVDGTRVHVAATKDEERVEAWFIDNKQDVSISPRYTRADGSVVLLRNISACRKQMSSDPDARPVPAQRAPRVAAPRRQRSIVADKPRKEFDPEGMTDEEIATALANSVLEWRIDGGVELMAISGERITVKDHPKMPGRSHRLISFWEQVPSKRGMVSGPERHVRISSIFRVVSLSR